MGAYEFVSYEDRYRPDVLRLREIFPGIASEWNEAHFHWQQEENPSFEDYWISLALFEGEVVGMRALQAAHWQVGSQVGPEQHFRAPCFAGTAIVADHQNRGLFSDLTRFAEEDLARRNVPYAFNLSAGPATYLGSLAQGWRAIGGLRPVIRNPGSGGNRLRDQAFRRLAGVWSRLRSPDPSSARARWAEMARIVAESPTDGRIRPLRSEAFLRWRFRDPSSTYRFIELERENRLCGYVVLQQMAPPLAPGPLHIADWERTGPVDWGDLLDAAVAYAERVQLPLVTWSATLLDSEKALLRTSGFEDVEARGPLAGSLPTVLVRALDPEGCNANVRLPTHGLDDLRSWDLRMICADPY